MAAEQRWLQSSGGCSERRGLESRGTHIDPLASRLINALRMDSSYSAQVPPMIVWLAVTELQSALGETSRL